METDGGISVTLAPEQFHFVDACVASGRYPSTDEVIRAGLDMLRERELRASSEVDRVQSMIEVGARDLDEGRIVDGGEVFRRLQSKHDALAASTSKQA